MAPPGSSSHCVSDWIQYNVSPWRAEPRAGESFTSLHCSLDPVAALRARHAAEGLRLHAGTGLAQWFGERLDVGWTIDVLHPRATRQGDAPTRAHRRDADES
jgi:hypothetical protein